MKWKEYCLDDIIHIKHGYAFKGEFFSEEPTDDILITPGNFAIGGGFKAQKLKYYNGDFPTDYILEETDIIVTMTDLSKEADTLGFSARVPAWQGKRFLHNQRIGLVKLKRDDFDINYIYWLMRTYFYQRYVANGATGATVKHTSPTKICQYKFTAPKDKTTQRRIASILSDYDDLIENNLRRIKLLEEKAELHYKELMQEMSYSKNNREEFIKDCLEFYIGGGWGEEEYKEGFTIPAFVIRGTDIPDAKKGEVKDVPFRYHKESNLASRSLQAGDLVFEVSGGSKGQPVGRSILITEKMLQQFGKPVMCASFCKMLRPNKKLTPEFFYLYLLASHQNGAIAQYEKHSASNIVNYGFEEFIGEQKIIIPKESELKEFTEKVKPIFTVISILGEQNSKLREARDILLPKLMNGEIVV